MFLSKNVQMTGMNSYSKYEFFTLADIIPPIIDIFEELNLIGLTSFGDGFAYLNIKDAESDDTIAFTIPYVLPEIAGANAIQNVGAAVTYLRRYLYMMALDIIEQDISDATQGMPKRGKPPTPEKRAETKDKVVGAQAQASDMLLKSMTKKAASLVKFEAESGYVDKVKAETENFTVVTKERADEIIREMGAKLRAARKAAKTNEVE